ncbi:MAG: lipoyl synthase [Clostridiales bacterium]|nr:lipoyl synthase [Clostridiales bacterium]
MNKALPARKPEWLRAKSGSDPECLRTARLLRALSLNTVCEEAGCPNRGECFRKRTATFMILGSNCTRNCAFCTVTKAPPHAVDPLEPKRVAEAVKALRLRHAVITSVTRDDLPDGGARHFAEVIHAVRTENAAAAPVIEVLIPDFQGDGDALRTVIAAAPDIINHNVETVPRLYPAVRPMAVYERSLELLARVKRVAPEIHTKSGIMAGLGETRDEVLQTLRDLRGADCGMLTIGQYLAPSKAHYPIAAYITPQEFARYRREAEELGFLHVASGPLVRSSYMAEDAFQTLIEPV